MTDNISSAGSSAVTSPSNPLVDLCCSLSHSDCFWVRLLADKADPSKLVAKDYYGRMCFFTRDTSIPTDWAPEQYALVTETLAKEKFRVVKMASYRCQDEAVARGPIGKLFEGVIDVAFESPSDNQVLSLLDARTAKIIAGEQLEAALQAEAERQMSELAELDEKENERRAADALFAAMATRLTPAGVTWSVDWRIHDDTYAFSDDSRAYQAGLKNERDLVVRFRKLPLDDQTVIRGFNWTRVGLINARVKV
ncbi:MAG: hypothetical protein WC869_00770 [Phycisphaerae bacterium]|jgi:hypothetical protein